MQSRDIQQVQCHVPCCDSGMLDDFVVVTITRPGQLYVRLKPDPRGLVIVNNFDRVPDDPDTGCPRLGPVEIVGSVMPGDALVSWRLRTMPSDPACHCNHFGVAGHVRFSLRLVTGTASALPAGEYSCVLGSRECFISSCGETFSSIIGGKSCGELK